MQYGCIGEVLKHSFSAEIHAMLNSRPYELCEVAREDLDAFLRDRNFLGINVTIPYKQAVLPYLAVTDPAAEQIGAVNTVVNREGRLFGYNTDFYGLQTLLGSLGADLTGKKVAILGTGGTSLTALAVAATMGAGEILRVSRREGAGTVTYEELYRQHTDVGILINTTPVGMYPHPEEMPVDLSRFPALEAVADVVYNPLRTELVLDAQKRRIPAAGGLLMLTAQAVRASEIFTGTLYPEGTAERICRILTERKETIVLEGMPGSGKTTVGRLLATVTGRTFVDLDEEIAKAVSASPAQIIREQGEPAFRDIETEVLRETLADLSGAVLALGGGTVLRPENVNMLRRNGRIYFLDRPVEKLLPTADRPLSATREGLERRYQERRDIYLAAADLRIPDPETPEAAVEIIRKDRKTE